MLQEIKDKILIVSADPDANAKLKGWIMEPDDCFGKGYDVENKYCKDCTVLSELDDRREQLFVFCKEICDNRPKEMVVPKLDITEKAQATPEPPVVKEEVAKEKVKVEKGGEDNMKGTTELIRKYLGEGKSIKEVVDAIAPTYVESGIELVAAKKRIRPQVYREFKKMGKVEVAPEAPAAEPTVEPTVAPEAV